MQLDGREDRMNRAAAVYLHDISAFKHKNNTIKHPGLYVTASKDESYIRSPSLTLLPLFKKNNRVKDGRCLSQPPFSPMSPTLYLFLTQQHAYRSLLGDVCLTFSGEFAICCQVDL